MSTTTTQGPAWPIRLPGRFALRLVRSAPPAPEEEEHLYTLLVATFSTRSAATSFSKQLPASWLEEVRVGDSLKFRVNYRHFDSIGEAHKALALLADRGFRGVVRACCLA